MIMLTFCVVLIRVVGAIGRAWYEDAPERSANLSIRQSRQINMTIQISKRETIDKIGAVNLVVIHSSNQYGEVIVAICSVSVVVEEFSPIGLPISGVSPRIFSTRSRIDVGAW
jgi:hypothetical protein